MVRFYSPWGSFLIFCSIKVLTGRNSRKDAKEAKEHQNMIQPSYQVKSINQSPQSPIFLVGQKGSIRSLIIYEGLSDVRKLWYLSWWIDKSVNCHEEFEWSHLERMLERYTQFTENMSRWARKRRWCKKEYNPGAVTMGWITRKNRGHRAAIPGLEDS